MQLVNRLRFDNLRGDLFGGLTAAIVPLPLALAFGVASGAGAIAGLYGAIFTKLMADNPDGIAMAFTAVMSSGVFQILFGILRLGQFITLMPYTVSGFMSGIGVIIVALQLAPLLGFPAQSSVLGSLQQ